ncbi:hypothetical protein TNCV_5064931 [Trichonephila clavipes]|nr:hypothetical protein TNCV_5064931 [Trichonephila clavipes]
MLAPPCWDITPHSLRIAAIMKDFRTQKSVPYILNKVCLYFPPPTFSLILSVISRVEEECKSQDHFSVLLGFNRKFEEINFDEELPSRVVKHSEIPHLIRQLALETIHCIPQTSLQIYTDYIRGDRGISGSGVHILTLTEVPSHVEIDSNEKANCLAKTVTKKELSPTESLALRELSYLKKIEYHLGRVPSSHPWYIGRNPGGSFNLMPRK